MIIHVKRRKRRLRDLEEHAQGLTAGNRCSWGLNPALSASPLCTLFTLRYPVLPLMCISLCFLWLKMGKNTPPLRIWWEFTEILYAWVFYKPTSHTEVLMKSAYWAGSKRSGLRVSCVTAKVDLWEALLSSGWRLNVNSATSLQSCEEELKLPFLKYCS